MRRVLVPLDGTPFAEAALPLARLIARRAGAELVLTHVVVPHWMPPSHVVGVAVALPLAAVPDTQTTHELRRARQDYLDDAVARTRAAMGPATPDRRAGRVPVDGTATEAESGGRYPVRGMLLDGEPAAAIHRAALDTEADLIVMASHGRHGFARFFFGSVAESVIRDGGVPVLVVPGDETPRADEAVHDPAAREAPLPRHLLVALDGSPDAEAILPTAAALARLLESRITLVTVRDTGRADRATLLPTAVLDTTASGGRAGAPVPITTGDAGSSAGGTEPAEAAYLVGLARRLAADDCRVETRLLDGHPVVDRLLDAATEGGADWFALMTHGRGLWGRLAEGSVAEAVLERARMPVLLLRPSAASVPTTG